VKFPLTRSNREQAPGGERYGLVDALLCGAAALFALAVFFLAYGWRILDPTYVNWLLVFDWGQNFLCWDAFRREPWTWPLGTIQNLNWPEGTSLIYNDCLPIVSIPLKLLHKVLPDPFQYHGWWLLACFMLSSAIGYLLFRKLTGQRPLSVLGAAFLPLLPYISERVVHFPLMAFWLILWAWLLYFSPARASTHLWFTCVLLLAVGINFYLLPMVMVIWGSWWLHSQAIPLLRRRSFSALGASAALMVVPLILLIPLMWALGYFVIPFSTASAMGFGDFSMNLNSWFNPAVGAWSLRLSYVPAYSPSSTGISWSIFLSPLPQTNDLQYEGFQYPGLGVLLLVLTALGSLVLKRPHLSGRVSRTYGTSGWWWVWLPCTVFTLFALSNKITFNQHELLDFEYPFPLDFLAGMFRASGRFFWPVNLILIAFALFVLSLTLSSRAAMGVAVTCLLVQVIDIHQAFPRRLDFPRSELTSADWTHVQRGSAYIGLVPRSGWDWMREGTLWPVVFMANRKVIPVNTMYVSRADWESLSRSNRVLLEQLSTDNLPSEASFLIDRKFVCSAPVSLKQRLRLLDGRILLPAKGAGEVGVPLDPIISANGCTTDTHAVGKCPIIGENGCRADTHAAGK
jgi:hypothetical protein